MLASYHDGQLDWEATWGAHLDELLEWRHVSAPGGEKRYLPIQDRRRNIVALYDTESFTLTALADYTAQGHRTALDSNEAVVCEEEGTGAICESLGGAFPFGFNTAWRSSRTGLYAMRHRWYSPTLGEFLSHDPLEEVDSFNLYAFAAHDPINNWDPYGLRSNSLARRQQYKVDEEAYQKLPQGQRDLLDQALEDHETGAPLGGFKPVVDPERFHEQDRCRINECITNPRPPKEMKSVDWEEVADDLLRVGIVSSPAGVLLWQGHEGLEPIVDPELEPKTELGAALGAAAGTVRPGIKVRSPKSSNRRGHYKAERGGNSKSQTKSKPHPEVDMNHSKKIKKQMKKRGWTNDMINEALETAPIPTQGKKGSASRYVHPETGKSIVVDNESGQVFHVGAKADYDYDEY